MKTRKEQLQQAMRNLQNSLTLLRVRYFYTSPDVLQIINSGIDIIQAMEPLGGITLNSVSSGKLDDAPKEVLFAGLLAMNAGMLLQAWAHPSKEFLLNTYVDSTRALSTVLKEYYAKSEPETEAPDAG